MATELVRLIISNNEHRQKLKLFWRLDLAGGSACHRITTWELAITLVPSKTMFKISASTLPLLCMWWNILTTSIVQHISRSEELAPSAISWRRKPLLSWSVFFCSQSVGLLQLFASWHQLWSDVQAADSSKPRSEGCFPQEQTWAR